MQPDYLTTMLDAYLECAWWADSPEQCQGQHKAPTKATRAKALNECAQFCRVAVKAGLDLSKIDASDCGHNLWLSRNGHGAGFWEANPEGKPASDGQVYRHWSQETGDKLHALAAVMGERNLYLVGRYFAIE